LNKIAKSTLGVSKKRCHLGNAGLNGGAGWARPKTPEGPILKEHEEAHFRIMQLAVQSELRRDPRSDSVNTREDRDQLVRDVVNISNPVAKFVVDKFDARTLHGTELRPQKPWQKERRLEREIRRAERIRERYPEIFKKLLNMRGRFTKQIEQEDE
jgi:hypothetical protein